MGCMFSSSSDGHDGALTTAVHIEIEAPIDCVWDIVTNIQALPKVVSFIEAVEFVGRDEANKQQPTTLKVGSRWIETRRFKVDAKGTDKQTKTVVHFEQEGQTRSLGVNVGFPRKLGGYEDCTNTCTFTVQTTSAASCAMVCSIAFHAAIMKYIPRCCGRRMLRFAKQYLLEELEDYKTAALEKLKSGTRMQKGSDR